MPFSRWREKLPAGEANALRLRIAGLWLDTLSDPNSALRELEALLARTLRD